MKQKIEQWLNQPPDEQDIKPSPSGGFHIPIERLRQLLNEVNYSTKNYHFQFYKDGYGKLAVAASIELEISYRTEDGDLIFRTSSGACNFALDSTFGDWNAVSQSMCIKNAAMKLAKRFGRDLNIGIIDEEVTIIGKPKSEKPKQKPDAKIMREFLKAVQEGDEATATLLSNMYEIKGEGDYA